MNLLVLICIGKSGLGKHFVITRLGQRWRCRDRRGRRNVGPTPWHDVKPAAKPNVAPTSPAYVAPTVLTTLSVKVGWLAGCHLTGLSARRDFAVAQFSGLAH